MILETVPSKTARIGAPSSVVILTPLLKVSIPLRENLETTVRDILGGVRSSCTYVGAPTLKQLSKCTTFVRVNNQYNDTFGKI